MIGGGPQKITVEIGGKIAASLGRRGLWHLFLYQQ